MSFSAKRNPRILLEGEGVKNSKDSKDVKESKESKEFEDSKEVKDSKESKDSVWIPNPKDFSHC